LKLISDWYVLFSQEITDSAMPKKPSHRSIVRDIRKELGFTQAQLAARLGTSWVTINRIENDSLKISRKLALRLSTLTGVLMQDILTNAAGPLRPWYGDFSGGNLDRLDQMARSLGPRQLKTLIGNATYRAELILMAALENAPRQLWSLDAAIEAAFDELEEEFGLRESVKKLRQSTSRPGIVAWIEERVGRPIGLVEQVASLASSPEETTAANLKKKPATSSRAKSSKKRRRQGI
jgi:DNA-binding XRE family transcriptional regulator